MDARPDADTGAISARDAGGDDTDGDEGTGSGDSGGGGTVASDASIEPRAPIPDGATQEPESVGAPGDDGPVFDDAAPPSVEDIADASPTLPTDSGDLTRDAETAPCDRDDDGEPSETCGGEDCDDDDPNVHPRQARYFVEPHDRVGFDYDCSGLIERDPLEPSLSCSLELAGCDVEAQGFMGETLPACGEYGDWGQCVQAELAGLPSMCSAQKLEERRAGCR